MSSFITSTCVISSNLLLFSKLKTLLIWTEFLIYSPHTVFNYFRVCNVFGHFSGASIISFLIPAYIGKLTNLFCSHFPLFQGKTFEVGMSCTSWNWFYGDYLEVQDKIHHIQSLDSQPNYVDMLQNKPMPNRKRKLVHRDMERSSTCLLIFPTLLMSSKRRWCRHTLRWHMTS